MHFRLDIECLCPSAAIETVTALKLAQAFPHVDERLASRREQKVRQIVAYPEDGMVAVVALDVGDPSGPR